MSNAAKFRKKAAELESQRDFDKAIVHYARAIEAGDAAGEEVDVAVLNKVGDLTLRLGRVPEAVASYERAVEHYTAVGLFNNAIALCNKILRHAPGRVGIYLTLGRVCARKGMRGDATRNFLEYASRMQKEGRNEEAMTSLSEVASLMPELTEVRRLVEEHAARVGIELPTVADAAAAQEQDKSTADSLVFLDIDYDAVPPTPPIGSAAVESGAPLNGNANSNGNGASASRELSAPPARTSSLDDLLIFDPSNPDDAYDLLEPLDGFEANSPEPAPDEGAIETASLVEGQLPADVAPTEPASVPEGLTDALGFEPAENIEVPPAELLQGLVAESEDGLLLDIESSLEASLEISFEASLETSNEASVEASLETSIETSLDVSLDASLDVSLDASADQPLPETASEVPGESASSDDSQEVEWIEVGSVDLMSDVSIDDAMDADREADREIGRETSRNAESVVEGEAEVGAGPENLAPLEFLDLDAMEAMDAESVSGSMVELVADETPKGQSLTDESAMAPRQDLTEESAELMPEALSDESVELTWQALSEEPLGEMHDVLAQAPADDATVEMHEAFLSDSIEAVQPEEPEDAAESIVHAQDAPLDTHSSVQDEAAVDGVLDNVRGYSLDNNAATADFSPEHVSLADVVTDEAAFVDVVADEAAFVEGVADEAVVADAEADQGAVVGEVDDEVPVAEVLADGVAIAEAGADEGAIAEVVADEESINEVAADEAEVAHVVADRPAVDAVLADEFVEAAPVHGEHQAADAEYAEEVDEEAEDAAALVHQASLSEQVAERWRTTPPRLNPHDFILPGELPPIVIPDAQLPTLKAAAYAPSDAPSDAAADPVAEAAIDWAHDGAHDVAQDRSIDNAAYDHSLLDLADDELDGVDALEATLTANAVEPFAALDTIETENAPSDTLDSLDSLDTLDADQPAEAAALEYLHVEDDSSDLDALLTPEAPTAVVNVALMRCERLREEADAHPGDWARRRRLAEALLEAGELEAGLTELATTVLGLEVQGELDDAARVSDDMVRAAPDNIGFHQKRVELAVRLGDRERLRESYLDLADALVRTGLAARAESVYVRVLELDPWDDRARIALGDAAPPPPARPSAPSSADDGYVNLADWLSDDGDTADTRMRLKEPTITGDENADFDQLLQHFREGVARSLGEDDYESHYDLGVAYKEMGLLDDAIAEFQRALRSPTHRLPAYEALGQCFLEQGSFPVAVTVLSRALHEPGLNDEQRVGVLYLLGYACEALQRRDEARSYFQRVYATDIQFRDVADRLAALEQVA